jgi:hypothetical protein
VPSPTCNAVGAYQSELHALQVINEKLSLPAPDGYGASHSSRCQTSQRHALVVTREQQEAVQKPFIEKAIAGTRSIHSVKFVSAEGDSVVLATREWSCTVCPACQAGEHASCQYLEHTGGEYQRQDPLVRNGWRTRTGSTKRQRWEEQLGGAARARPPGRRAARASAASDDEGSMCSWQGSDAQTSSSESEGEEHGQQPCSAVQQGQFVAVLDPNCPSGCSFAVFQATSSEGQYNGRKAVQGLHGLWIRRGARFFEGLPLPELGDDQLVVPGGHAFSAASSGEASTSRGRPTVQVPSHLVLSSGFDMQPPAAASQPTQGSQRSARTKKAEQQSGLLLMGGRLYTSLAQAAHAALQRSGGGSDDEGE